MDRAGMFRMMKQRKWIMASFSSRSQCTAWQDFEHMNKIVTSKKLL
jgi:hypothetical protein